MLTEIEVKITMEDSMCLSAVHVPNELSVDERCCWAHHAIDPFRVVECLIDKWRFIVPLTVHVEVVGALEWNSASRAYFLVSCSNCQTDLTCHGGTANDWLVHLDLLNECSNESDVSVFRVRVLAYYGVSKAYDIQIQYIPGQ